MDCRNSISLYEKIEVRKLKEDSEKDSKWLKKDLEKIFLWSLFVIASSLIAVYHSPFLSFQLLFFGGLLAYWVIHNDIWVSQILYLSNVKFPPTNECDEIQNCVSLLVKKGEFPDKPLVILAAMLSQISDPGDIQKPFTLSQLYLLSTSLASFYSHQISTQYKNLIHHQKEKRKKKKKFLENCIKFGRNFVKVMSNYRRWKKMRHLVRMGKCLDYYCGAGFAGRYETFYPLGTLVAKFHQELFINSQKLGINLLESCKKMLKIEQEEFRINTSFVLKPQFSHIGNEYYNPTNTKALHRFEQVKTKTQCFFASKSRLWSAPDWNQNESFLWNVQSCVPVLIKFMTAARYEQLDGFVFEIPDDKMQYGHSPEQLGRTLKQLLLILSEADPAGEDIMKFVSSFIYWQFKFSGQAISIASFAPCYPRTSQRYSFGSSSVWFLLQPDFCISFQEVVGDGRKGGTRDRIRAAYARAGRPYLESETIESKCQYVLDLTGKPVVWWK